ncbi:deSI-like protein [Senna tora]|uniref:DeSI-like protein n=1 Tax=Senna tora TaxID=362788 RepID=A0A834W6Y4_9FABA|nr:deSI-like protein [Senna tora]
MATEASNSISTLQCLPNNHYSTPLVLNVYDLTPLNNYMYWIGLGIFHSGIEVHGKEYGFGAHEFPTSGVFEVEPRMCPGFIYRRSITLGQINIHPSDFRMFIEKMALEYYGDTYQLLSKNCNHFTDDVSRRLIGKGIPGWVNRLAKLELDSHSSCSHFLLGILCSCLLPESLKVSNVQQHLPECQDNLEDDDQETDDDQEKQLLPSLPRFEDVCFVEETPRA